MTFCRTFYCTSHRTIHCADRNNLFLLLVAVCLWLPLFAHAAFITDKVTVDVYAQRFNQGAVLKTIASGSSVEVLMSDGQFSRIRTADNITGWVESKFITNEQPLQLEYLELLNKNKSLEADLKAAEEKLANSADTTVSNISDAELEELRKRASDAGWMRVELKKARDKADELEASLKAKGNKAANSAEELKTLREKNDDLEKRLAAALLVNQQQEAEVAALETAADQEDASADSALSTLPTTEDNSWQVNIEWFLGSIFTALIIGLVTGITWLDKRIRQRHGGFRIY